MKPKRNINCSSGAELSSRLIVAAAALAFVFTLAGCGADKPERAAEMTSYSSKEAKGAAPELFTIPQEQMSHVQVVTVAPGKITRTLRLTGAVAYNAFATTPVITQVGGPVSRILVVPGQFVKRGEPLLEVTSPDYSQMLAVYLKARDVARVASKNWDRAQDLYQHHAIAERDLLQAESDRNQAQADMNAAEQSMKILGIPKPEDLEKSPSSAEVRLLAPISGQVVERLVAPGQVLQAGATQAFTISDMSTVWVLANVYQADLADVKTGRLGGCFDRLISRRVPRKDFVHFAGARPDDADSASANRRRQQRREIKEGYVLHGFRHGRRNSKCDCGAGRRDFA